MNGALNYEEAHAYVDSHENAFWDGWDIVVWRPARQGSSHQRGLFRNGRWGIADRYKVTTKGTWYVKDFFARLPRSS